MPDSGLIDWLLNGDVSIQFQVYRDLLKKNRPDFQDRISSEGWGEKLLSFRKTNGHWGAGFYYPKWTSSHYTILQLKEMGISPHQLEIKETILKERLIVRLVSPVI